MDNAQETIAILLVHRENLANSKTFEEYRDHHAAYVDMIIARMEADLTKREATTAFADRVSWQVVADAVEATQPEGERT